MKRVEGRAKGKVIENGNKERAFLCFLLFVRRGAWIGYYNVEFLSSKTVLCFPLCDVDSSFF